MISIQQVGRALCALGAVVLLSVDDVETEEPMQFTQEQLEYARRTLVYRAPEILSPGERALLRAAFPERTKPTTTDHVAWAEYNADEVPGPLCDLLTAVRRAASELQDGGERENRIALQLLAAMARFRAEVDEACRPGNPANKAWFERWEREFSCRWVQRGNKFYPADSKVKP